MARRVCSSIWLKRNEEPERATDVPRHEHPRASLRSVSERFRAALTGFSTDTARSWLREPLPCPGPRASPLPSGPAASCLLLPSPLHPAGKAASTGEPAPPPARLTCKAHAPCTSHLQGPRPLHGSPARPRPSTEAGSLKASSLLTRAAADHFQRLEPRAQPQSSTSEVRSAPRSSQNRLPLPGRSQHPGPSAGLRVRAGPGRPRPPRRGKATSAGTGGRGAFAGPRWGQRLVTQTPEPQPNTWQKLQPNTWQKLEQTARRAGRGTDGETG